MSAWNYATDPFYRAILAAFLCASASIASARNPVVLQLCLVPPAQAPAYRQGDAVSGCKASITFGVDRMEKAQPFEDYEVLRIHLVQKDRPRVNQFIEDHSYQLAWLLRARKVVRTIMFTEGSTAFIDLPFESEEDEASLRLLLDMDE